MKMLLHAFIFLIFVHLVSGTKISNIQISNHFMDVEEGQQLLIPCEFTYDGPLDTAQIQLDWGMTPEHGGEFRPLIGLSDTTLLAVENPNLRARLDPAKVRNGDCSIIIDSIQPDDIGTYKIHLTINGEELTHDTEVKVTMKELQEITDTEISSIQMSYAIMDVKEGQQLLIPCKFTYDGPLDKSKIHLEWGMTPEDGGEFRPLIKMSNTFLLPVKNPNPRADLDPAKVQDGDCSISIDFIRPEDIGTYKFRLAINGEEFKESPEIRVNMWKIREPNGAKITSIEISKRFLEAEEGGQLVIPCLFNIKQRLDNPLSNHPIKLEWGMTPEHGRGYQPLIRLSGNVQQPVKQPNPRAHLDLMHVNSGHCTMTIDDVKPEDSGTYKVFIAIDREEYKHPTEVMVNIKKHKDTTDTKISSIQLSDHSLVIKEGQQLVIPCKFIYDGPLEESKIQLEWGMTPEHGGEFRQLIRLSDTMFLPVKNSNPRAHLDPAKVQGGDCSIIIDSIQPDDIGTYKIHLTINGEEHKESPEIRVNIWKIHETNGAHITNIEIKHYLNAEEGAQLVLPCIFQHNLGLGNTLGGHHIKLEWGMTPERGRGYQPLIRLSGGMQQPIRNPNPRVQMDLMGVNSGHCAITIDNVKLEDSGTYKVFMAIDGEEYKHATEVVVNIWKHQETTEPTSGHILQARANRRSKTNRNQLGSPDINPSVMEMAKLVQRMMNDGSIKYLLILTAAIILLVLVIIGIAICFTIHYCRLKRKYKDIVVQMEEGRSSGKTDDSTSEDS